MVITQASQPGLDTCSCNGRLSDVSSRTSEYLAREPLSLESLASSLASGEVKRMRTFLGAGASESVLGWVSHDPRGSDRPADHKSGNPKALNAGETAWSKVRRLYTEASEELLKTVVNNRALTTTRSIADATVSCVGRICKLAISRVKEVAISGWTFFVTHSGAQWAINTLEQCIGAIRGWMTDSPKQSKGYSALPAALESDGGLTWSDQIPRVVVVPRNESQRPETRRRSRGPRKRGELLVVHEGSSEIADELEMSSDRKEEQQLGEETRQEERTARAIRRIREIDAQFGTTSNNPRVAEVLAQLGTHYDSIERAIEMVYALQHDELRELEHVLLQEQSQEVARIDDAGRA